MEENALTKIKGIGEKRAESFRQLGIYTSDDLLSFLPRSYTDMTKITRIKDIENGQTVLVEGLVCSDVTVKRTKKIAIYKFDVTDEKRFSEKGSFSSEFGTIDRMTITLFNQKYTADKIKPDKKIYLYGKAQVYGNTVEMNSPVIEEKYDGGLRAVYPLKNGISNKIINNTVKTLMFGSSDFELKKLKELNEEEKESLICTKIKETLPENIRVKYSLCSLRQAYLGIHFPQSFEEVEQARKRLAFEELLVFQISLVMMKRQIKRKIAPQMSNEAGMSEFFELLPFELTSAQKRVIDEAYTDMKKPSPMSRIVQGDVGSGKTVVAAALCYIVKQNGMQSCLMVPTEILAIQHYKDLSELLGKCGMTVELLTSGTSGKEKKRIKADLSSGKTDLLIGTHSIIEDDISFNSLSLSITDEQHRFGVKQRAKLSGKGANGLVPHVLVMSATPIPRTLALILYGDMDISVIDVLPAGRKKVSTFLLDSCYNERLYRYVADQVRLGNQSYVVCPLVEEGDDENLKSVEQFAEEIRSRYLKDGHGALQEKIITDSNSANDKINTISENNSTLSAENENIGTKQINIEFLHGKMPGKEKDRILKEFSQNIINVLVSTTVIEVGVNVPNATIMIIQNAERFGLSQLHQLRGRVGRSDKKSYCFLISDTKSESTAERLRAFCETNDGFEISKKDLEIRGPGDFFGKKQHGLPDFKIADIMGDMEIFLSAKAAASELMEDKKWSEKAENEELKHEVSRFFIRYERETSSQNNI